jgi:hypothetical protein
MEENWKLCGDSPRRIYEVSNYGNVRSITKSNKLVNYIKPKEHTSGYLRVVINKKHMHVAHLVAKNFIGDRPEKFVVDHIDRNRHNNRYDNLRYCSHQLNNLNRSKPGQGWKLSDKEIERRRKNNARRFATKIKCECGVITDMTHKSRHIKTRKHSTLLTASFQTN